MFSATDLYRGFPAGSPTVRRQHTSGNIGLVYNVQTILIMISFVISAGTLSVDRVHSNKVNLIMEVYMLASAISLVRSKAGFVQQFIRNPGK